MNWMVPAAFFVFTAMVAGIATAVLAPVLRRTQILDHPNHRSSHRAPTPRGAGLAVIPVVAAAWIGLETLGPGVPDEPLVWTAAGALVLCALSWIDDLAGLSPLFRFAGHVVVVASLLSRLPAEVLHFQGLLPLWADRLAAGLLWVWFINLFNFMDGIDGISGVEALFVAAGIAALAFLVPSVSPLAAPALAVAGGAAGFLVLNWHPAKIFLGDSGSVPLGLLLGWLLLELAAAGLWAAALVLPFYYLADATVTLLRRLLRGEKVWQAHRQHFYQQAVARGLSHGRVALTIAAANAALIVLALLSLYDALAALAGAALVTFLLLAALQGRTAKP